MCEYYNKTPVSLTYRGLKGSSKETFVRNFLENFRIFNLLIIVVYHGDLNFPQDDINWFYFKELINKC